MWSDDRRDTSLCAVWGEHHLAPHTWADRTCWRLGQAMVLSSETSTYCRNASCKRPAATDCLQQANPTHGHRHNSRIHVSSSITNRSQCSQCARFQICYLRRRAWTCKRRRVERSCRDDTHRRQCLVENSLWCVNRCPVVTHLYSCMDVG